MADVLDSGPDDPGTTLAGLVGGGPVAGPVDGSGWGPPWSSVSLAIMWAVRAPPPANDASDLPRLTVVGGQVKLDTLDRAAAVSLTLVNTGPSTYLDAMEGLPARLVFVPPRGGLSVPGGTGTQLPAGLAGRRLHDTGP